MSYLKRRKLKRLRHTAVVPRTSARYRHVLFRRPPLAEGCARSDMGEHQRLETCALIVPAAVELPPPRSKRFLSDNSPTTPPPLLADTGSPAQARSADEPEQVSKAFGGGCVQHHHGTPLTVGALLLPPRKTREKRELGAWSDQ